VKRYEVNYGICQNWYNHTYRSCILEIKKYYGNNIPKSELPGCISDDFTHSNQEQKEYFLKRIAEIIQWEENVVNISFFLIICTYLIMFRIY